MSAARTSRTATQPADGGLDVPSSRGDLVAAFGCLLTAVIGAFAVVPAWVYVPDKVAGTINSPAVMPMLVLALLGLFGALLLAETWRKQIAGQAHRTPKDWLRAGGMIAICGLYLALILIIGLPVATAIAVAAAMVYFGERRWIVVLPVAVITPLLLWAFFAYVAHIPMPQPQLRIGAPDMGLTVTARPSIFVPERAV